MTPSRCWKTMGGRPADRRRAVLLPLMKLRFAEPEALVDINDLTELQRIW
jgi:hypothetical protein